MIIYNTDKRRVLYEYCKCGNMYELEARYNDYITVCGKPLYSNVPSEFIYMACPKCGNDRLQNEKDEREYREYMILKKKFEGNDE